MRKSALRVRAKRIAEVRRTLGENVRRQRRACGLTQAALAERMGIEPQSLQRVELGTGSPSLALIVSVADALAVDVVVLFQPIEKFTKPKPGRPPARRR